MVLQQVWSVLTIAQVVQAPVEARPLLLDRGEDPVAVFVEEGRRLGFVRPSTRTVVRAPEPPPEDLAPPPEGLVLLRAPRSARRRCGPRAA